MRVAGDERILAESVVLAQVGNIDQFGAANRRRAEADLARAAEEVGRQAVPGLEPYPLLIDEAEIADRTFADLRRKLADLVVGGIGRGVENVECAHGGNATRLVLRDRE